MAGIVGNGIRYQDYSATTQATRPPYAQFSALLFTGRAKQQECSVRVGRQVEIDTPPDAVVVIDCPPGPKT